MDNRIREVLILGGGTAGWMTAAYLVKAFGSQVKITVVESPGVPKIGVGEATVPNLQSVFFDFLGLREEEWMPCCNAAFKGAVKFINWRKPVVPGATTAFYHPFGLLPQVDNVPLSHYWFMHRHDGNVDSAMDYACFREPWFLDAKLSPKLLDGTRAMRYAWHFDAHLVADFLQGYATSRGVHHAIDTVADVKLRENGHIEALHGKSGARYAADLFVDCSGFRGLLINKALGEPFIDMTGHLFCDSAVACPVPHDDAKHGVEPFTSAIAMRDGWVWKIPMLGRFGSGYVYSSKFVSQDQATSDFLELWGLDGNSAKLNHIRFRTGRNRRAWVGNCVSIGLSSCFLEPLESTGIYFICASIYQLAKHFPDRTMNPAIAGRFNAEIEAMFDDSRDFLQAHYLTSTRDDTPFWLANKNDINLSDSIKEKIATYKAGLIVNMPPSDESNYYANFETEFRNFWTNGSYYAIFTGMGMFPDAPMPKLRYRPEAVREADQKFAALRQETLQWKKRLPSNHEYLQALHSGQLTAPQRMPERVVA
jgi:tryptophan 6-halogenase